MKVAKYVVDLLSNNGIDTVFGQIGGFNADLIDAIARSEKQKFVPKRNAIDPKFRLLWA